MSTLSAKLLQAQDEERRRLARELHDSAGQLLAVLAMNLGEIQRSARDVAPKVFTVAGEGQALVQRLAEEVRTTSYLLHPPLLDESGLPVALDLYLSGLAERSGVKVELSIPEMFGRLPAEAELAVFRIVQECLTNIHRHSGSETAAIRISREGDRVYLEIQDEGKGMSAEKLALIHAQRSGLGIAGMRERVRHLGGELNVESSERGTKISAAFPVPQRAASEPHGAAQRAAGGSL